VSDLGGGLVMIGGPDSFGAGAWTRTPIDAILPVNCEIPSQTILPSGALLIVLDCSGSMGSSQGGVEKMEIANEAAVQAVSTLYPQDLVGVIAFDTEARWIVNLTDVRDGGRIIKMIRSIHPGGGTNMYPAMLEAYTALAKLGPEDAAIKHVIVLTDGQSSPGPFFEVLGKMARAGITLSTVGVGDDVDAKLLTSLAQMGGGSFYLVQDPKRLPQIFIKEARTIRKNLLKEKPFTPTLVPTGSPVLAGIAKLPQLQGLVLTGPKNDPRVYMPLVGPEGEPLFAHWQVGLGRVAAFTSDATNRWATAWLNDAIYADFWARAVRLIARPSSSKAYDLAGHIERDRLHLRLDATGSAPGAKNIGDGSGASSGGGYQNFLRITGSVLAPDGAVVPVTLVQSGPGVYEAEVSALPSGNYIVTLLAQSGPNTPAHAIIGGVTKPRGSELRTFSSNRANLEQVASITGGRMLDPAKIAEAGLFTRTGLRESRSLRPLAVPLLLALIVIFLLDVAVRRIAWDLAGIWAWALDRADAVFGLFQARPAEASNATTLTALKKKAAQTEHKRGTGEVAVVVAAVPAPDAQRKFETRADVEPAQDFAAAVGAAKDEPVATQRLSAPKPGAAADEPATTSRLLDAKRRAQDRMEKKG